MRQILSHANFQVIEASSGEEALQLLESEKVDLVISDLKMPGMSGADLVNELREWDTTLPVVFVSGWAKEKDWLDAIRTHASAMIPKPFRSQAILSAVQKALQER